MSRFFASLSALHWGLLALSFAMLTYALLPTAGPEAESDPLHSSPQSPATAPWLESVAVIVEEPLEAEKVMPLVVVALIGVTSLNVPPDSI